MEIKVKHTSSFAKVSVVEGHTTIDLALMNDSERDDLARTLIEAAFDIGPEYNNTCAEWFAGMLERCGIPLPNA